MNIFQKVSAINLSYVIINAHLFILFIINLMAFVSQSARKINEISKTMCPLGPGQYFKDERNASKQDCAPFQSTSRRKSFLEANERQQPGPGNYEVSRPFIQPNIKTVSNSQSIIVKINSTGTAQFKSVVDRFDSRDHQVPGPGQYQHLSNKSPKSHSHSKSRAVYDDRIIEKLRKLSQKKNYPTIPQKTRGLTDTKKEEVNPEGKLGPAYYNPGKKYFLNSTSTTWGKDRSKRFSVDARAEVGPGKYNTFYNPIKPEDKVNQASSHFRSSTVRTYFDSLFYKTNISDTAKIRDKTNFKSKEPAPGQYQTNFSSIKTSEKPFALQFFGSTVERFPENQEQLEPSSRRHKSFYNIRSEIGKNRSFNKSEHAFLADSVRKPEFLQVSEKDRNPGPGYYKENIKIEKKLKGNKVQKFGTNSKRMFQEDSKDEVVGPGAYFDDRKKEKEPKNTRFGQISNIDSNFKSSTNRDCFGLSRVQKNPFAQYEVSHYDLSKKIEKQKHFIDNLKKIDVERPGFESSISRFPHYQSRQKSEHQNNAEQSRKQEMKLKEQGEKIREMVLSANQAQVKQVQKHHFGKTQRFQSSKKSAPPVGNYNLRSNWQKKSHNVKYNNK